MLELLMNDILTASAQRNITYVWLVGFFGIIIAQGLGYLKDVPNDVYTLTAVVLFFWFQRTRGQQPDANTEVTVKSTSITPDPPKDPP
jgi:hypothetical protein